MQNARLHIAHVAAGARRFRWAVEPSAEAWEESGMMVLLVKHVHLQNEGGARRSLAMFSVGSQGGRSLNHLPSANTDKMRAQSASRSIWRRAIITCCNGVMIG
jgi:hypothetical protein